MNKDNMMKWVLIAAAAALVFFYLKKQGTFDSLFGSSQPAEKPPVKPPVVNPQLPAGNINVAPPATAADTSIRGRLLAASGNAQTMTADQWNWYYGQVTGTPQTTDLFPADDRNFQMTVDGYLSARKSAGLSGLAGLLAGYQSLRGGWVQ